MRDSSCYSRPGYPEIEERLTGLESAWYEWHFDQGPSDAEKQEQERVELPAGSQSV